MDASIFDVNKAKSLVNEPNSALALVTRTKHVTLPPCYMGRLRTGIKDILDSELKRHSELLGGVLIAYENILLVQPYGHIHSDEPFIHFKIQADFIVFQPQIGITLKGVVNRISRNHVGCLVHNCFNASLPRPASSQDDWLGDTVSMKQEVIFQVTHLDLSSQVIFIRGAILSVGEKPVSSTVDDLVTTFIDKALVDHPVVNGEASENECTLPDTSSKSQKRKASVWFDVTPPEVAKIKKLKLDSEVPGTSQTKNDSSLSVKKKKKHQSDKTSRSPKKKKNDKAGSNSKEERLHKKHKKHKKHKDKSDKSR